jgi:hypothetical protein
VAVVARAAVPAIQHPDLRESEVAPSKEAEPIVAFRSINEAQSWTEAIETEAQQFAVFGAHVHSPLLFFYPPQPVGGPANGNHANAIATVRVVRYQRPGVRPKFCAAAILPALRLSLSERGIALPQNRTVDTRIFSSFARRPWLSIKP